MKQPWSLSSFTVKITLMKEAGTYSALMLVCLFNIKPSRGKITFLFFNILI